MTANPYDDIMYSNNIAPVYDMSAGNPTNSYVGVVRYMVRCCLFASKPCR